MQHWWHTRKSKYISAENLHSHILFRHSYTVLLTYSAISHRPQSCLLAAVALTVFLSTTTAEPSFPQHPATLLLLESALSPSSRNFLKPSENPHEKHSAVPLPQNMAGKYLSALPFSVRYGYCNCSGPLPYISIQYLIVQSYHPSEHSFCLNYTQHGYQFQ